MEIKSRPFRGNGPEQLQEFGLEVCKATLRHKRAPNRAPISWWSEDVHQKRRCVISAKRLRTRKNKSRNVQELKKMKAIENYKNKRKELRQAIKAAKQKSYDDLLDDLDKDPWGRAYKMVTKK